MGLGRRTHQARAALALALALAGGGLTAVAAGAEPLSAIITKPAKAPPPPADDGLAGGGFYLESNTLIRDDAHNKVTAEGAVEVRYKGRVLRADEVDYQTDTGVVAAHGHVTILNADGTSQYATSMTLDKDMSEGMALGFSSRLQGDVKISAAATRRRNANVTELDRVIFTPCQVCAENGQRNPTWSIRARKVIEDHAHKTLYFQDAVIQVKGVGILFLPAFWTADPTSQRKSGFLLPMVTISGSRGFSYEQPYYLVISPSQDLTLAPQINSRVSPFLNAEYRERFYSGVLDIRGGATDDQDFTSGGTKFGPVTTRSYVLGSGQFNISSDWQWGFTAERTSDKLLFEKYAIYDVYADRGLYAADGGRLISQIDTVRQDQNSYLSIAAVSVQGLRPTDIQSVIPTIAPLIEARFEPSSPVLGGRLRLDASAVALTEDQAPSLTGAPGVDSRRATAQLDWRTAVTLDDGLRIQPFILGRADLYNLSNLAAPYASNATIPRAFGTVGADISYPLIKQTSDATYILEPMAQIAISPNTRLDPRIPNDDSEVWQFDDTNLFDVNRAPGYDLYEGGQMLTLGGRATAMLADGRSGSLIIGRSLRAESDPDIPANTGLQTPLSDWIIGAEVTPIKGISLFSHWRLDTSTLAINRLEAGVNFTTSRASGYVSYLQEAQSPLGGKVTSLDMHGEVFATQHWGATVYAIVDGGTWRQSDIGLVYRDDCIRVEVLYRRNETFNGTLGPSTSVILRLSFATSALSGYTH